MEWRVRNVWKAWNYWVGIYINVDALEFEKTIPSYLISLNLIHYIIGEEILTKNFSNSILQKRKNSERERKDTLKIPTFPVGVIKSRIFNTHSNARRKFLFPFYKKEKKKRFIEFRIVSKLQLSLLVRLLFSTIYYRSSGRPSQLNPTPAIVRESVDIVEDTFYPVHRILDRRFSRNKPIKSGRCRSIRSSDQLTRFQTWYVSHVSVHCSANTISYLPRKIDNQLSNISQEILKINFSIYIYICI